MGDHSERGNFRELTPSSPAEFINDQLSEMRKLDTGFRRAYLIPQEGQDIAEVSVSANEIIVNQLKLNQLLGQVSDATANRMARSGYAKSDALNYVADTYVENTLGWVRPLWYRLPLDREVAVQLAPNIVPAEGSRSFSILEPLSKLASQRKKELLGRHDALPESVMMDTEYVELTRLFNTYIRRENEYLQLNPTINSAVDLTNNHGLASILVSKLAELQLDNGTNGRDFLRHLKPGVEIAALMSDYTYTWVKSLGGLRNSEPTKASWELLATLYELYPSYESELHRYLITATLASLPGEDINLNGFVRTFENLRRYSVGQKDYRLSGFYSWMRDSLGLMPDLLWKHDELLENVDFSAVVNFDYHIFKRNQVTQLLQLLAENLGVLVPANLESYEMKVVDEDVLKEISPFIDCESLRLVIDKKGKAAELEIITKSGRQICTLIDSRDNMAIRPFVMEGYTADHAKVAVAMMKLASYQLEAFSLHSVELVKGAKEELIQTAANLTSEKAKKRKRKQNRTNKSAELESEPTSFTSTTAEGLSWLKQLLHEDVEQLIADNQATCTTAVSRLLNDFPDDTTVKKSIAHRRNGNTLVRMTRRNCQIEIEYNNSRKIVRRSYTNPREGKTIQDVIIDESFRNEAEEEIKLAKQIINDYFDGKTQGLEKIKSKKGMGRIRYGDWRLFVRMSPDGILKATRLVKRDEGTYR